ncbi:MAG TPA: methyltransferase [Phycisphaerae bacterium]|nr:methyltransferase [Phycisphaerae bacterium]
MAIQQTEPRWLERIQEIPRGFDDVRFPEVDVSQDREWCEMIVDGERRRIRLHDYHRLYEVPGLYEWVFYECLECCSPSRVARLLESLIEDFAENPEDLRVLDIGAGNGMVGDELEQLSVERIIGIDIIEEAKTATERDRPGVYDDYLVTDLTDLPELVEERLRGERLNCLTSVAALGFGDLPSKAFLKALDLISAPGWVAFNIKEDFLCERDETGFCELIRQLSRERIIQMQAYRRYQHRLSVTGKPLYYVVVVAKKLKGVPEHMMESFDT